MRACKEQVVLEVTVTNQGQISDVKISNNESQWLRWRMPPRPMPSPSL